MYWYAHSHVFQLFTTTSGAQWRQANVENSLFYSNKDVASIIEQVEVITADIMSLMIDSSPLSSLFFLITVNVVIITRFYLYRL